MFSLFDSRSSLICSTNTTEKLDDSIPSRSANEPIRTQQERTQDGRERLDRYLCWLGITDTSGGVKRRLRLIIHEPTVRNEPPYYRYQFGCQCLLDRFIYRSFHRREKFQLEMRAKGWNKYRDRAVLVMWRGDIDQPIGG